MVQWLEHLESKTISCEGKLYKAINNAFEKVEKKRVQIADAKKNNK